MITTRGRLTLVLGAGALTLASALVACAHAEFGFPESTPHTEDEGPPPPPSGARVVFTRVDDGAGHVAYAPVACYDVTRHTSLGGAPCADLVPQNAELHCVGAAGTITVGGRTPVACGPPAVTAGAELEPWQAFPVVGPGVACDVAVWAQDAGPQVVPVPRVAPRVAPTELATLEARVRQLYPEASEHARVSQAVSLDLDGDGAKDRVIAFAIAPPAAGAAPVAAPTAAPAADAGNDAGVPPAPPPPRVFAPGELAFSGVGLGYAATPSDVVLLHRDPRLYWRLKAVMDIDGDGTPELWFTAWSAAVGGADIPAPNAPHVDIVERVVAGRALRLGSLDCMQGAPP